MSIPRRLIRSVPAETTSQVEDWWTKLAHMHPGWQMVTYRDPIDPVDFPFTAAYWARCTSGAQLAGLVRLEALFAHGGIWVDSDIEPVRPLTALLALEGFAAWEDEMCVPDAVLGFTAAHPVLMDMMVDAVSRVEDGAWASGPGVTTRHLPGRDDVLLLPPGSFFPVHYQAKDQLDGYTPPPWCFAVHHWHASWLPEEVTV